MSNLFWVLTGTVVTIGLIGLAMLIYFLRHPPVG